MSVTAAELLHRVQQEAADAAAPAPGTIVLAPQSGLKFSSESSADHRHIAYADGHQTDVRLTKYPDTAMPQWFGRERRRDTDGRIWERSIWAIVDDFGTLVEVTR
jgi:hypothetical protein